MWDPAFLIAFVPVLLFSLTFHEFAHAWSAYRLGDPTAAAMGRLTLNPLRHLDVFGTLVLVMSGFRFGWAKPVPVNIFNFRDPKFGMFLSAAAGPASNILLALGCGILLRMTGSGGDGYSGAVTQVLFWGLVMNLSLAFFNLIPIPPLDGSKIILGLSPDSWEEPLMKFQRVGPMLLFGLIAIGFIAHVSPLWLFIGPFVKFFAWLFAGISLGF
ncbi:site-2 protease family protein [Candidatus Zixiibacteriota bacterium]